jgi:hypothetical protein
MTFLLLRAEGWTLNAGTVRNWDSARADSEAEQQRKISRLLDAADIVDSEQLKAEALTPGEVEAQPELDHIGIEQVGASPMHRAGVHRLMQQSRPTSCQREFRCEGFTDDGVET